jgi:hypothetical protein
MEFGQLSQGRSCSTQAAFGCVPAAAAAAAAVKELKVREVVTVECDISAS